MTAGRRTAFQVCAALALAGAAAAVLPGALELFALLNATVWTAMALLALSLALAWGAGGILCFGQTAGKWFQRSSAAQRRGTHSLSRTIVGGAALRP